MYTTIDFETKKALKEAVGDYNHSLSGDFHGVAPEPVTYFQPGQFGGNEPKNDTFCVEAPHYPRPHKWYATCKAVNGIIVSVK